MGNTSYMAIHIHAPEEIEFQELPKINTLVVRFNDATSLYFSPEGALDFARRLFDLAGTMANAMEGARVTVGPPVFKEDEGANGEAMMVCSKCGNGNFVNYPDSYHCIHYKERANVEAA